MSTVLIKWAQSLLTAGHIMINSSHRYLDIGEMIVVFIIHHTFYPMMHLKREINIYFFLSFTMQTSTVNFEFCCKMSTQ